MNEINGDKKDTDLDEVDEVDETSEEAADAMPDIGGDTMIDVTAELKVDELVAKIDSVDPDEAAHAREVRRRVEELQEKQDKELDSTFNINLDEDA